MANLVKALQNPAAYPHTVENIELVETHISLVFLTGPYAYKVKKAVNLGFLDFSTLANRKRFCREELRLNRRLCPDLYLDVVAVTEEAGRIMIGSKGKILEYAVKMVQFDRRMELDILLKQNRITKEHIDQISSSVADFHRSIPAVEPDSPYGRPDILVKPIRDNFTEAERLNRDNREAEQLATLKAWTESEFIRLTPLFLSRKASGRIKECHGDMHTGNMVLWNNRVMIFDCIEFNPYLSKIDVISEIAFLVMDLEHSGYALYAARFLNTYLSLTGDYDSLALLGFYKTYRAMVRAKVTAIRHLQERDPKKKQRLLSLHRSYISTALEYTAAPPSCGLVIMHGVSGSGKTTVAKALASRIPAIHIRSDIERKRLFDMKPLEKSSPEKSKEIYSDKSSALTYERLYSIASLCLQNGFTVIADATFLRHAERKRFAGIGKKTGRPAILLHCDAPKELLEQRVGQRYKRGRDASEADLAILRQQLRSRRPLSAEEENIAVSIDTSLAASIEAGVTEALKRISSTAQRSN